MSLVQFHIILVSTAILFGVGFGFWEMGRAAGSSCGLDCWTGIASFAVSGALALYLVWFLRRLKQKNTKF